MSDSEQFYSLLFEVSHEIRHNIMIQLKTSKLRITDIARKLELNNPETRRHVSRLAMIKIIKRDEDGFYHLTPYGETVLGLFREHEFLSRHSDYFEKHRITLINEKLRSIGELYHLNTVSNPMEFFQHIELLLKEAEDHVWLLVDQFPIQSISTIAHSIDKGVNYRLLEKKGRSLNPDFNLLSMEDKSSLTRARFTPMVEQRIIDNIDLILIVSEKRCILAFPTIEGIYDYIGFTGTDKESIEWSTELFQQIWDISELRVTSEPPVTTLRTQLERNQFSNYVTVEGKDNPDIDLHVVQDAVDNFSEVKLSGLFNFGNGRINITQSVKIIGENSNGEQSRIYKQGWDFPFTQHDAIFLIDSEDDVVEIKNINFSDFNWTSIWIKSAKNILIKNNSFTLPTGYGRGMTYGAFGDVVMAIWVEDASNSIYKGNIEISENYFDFATGGASGGFLSRGGRENNPEYRPDLRNHEFYMGFGMGIHRCSGTVEIKNNHIKNMNSRGLGVTDNLESATILIHDNLIESDLYGAYPFSSPEAGAGILVQSAWGFPSRSYHVEIKNNEIRYDKPNFTGIKILGPSMDRKGADKLKNGLIHGNRIHLDNGYEGIHLRRCDKFTVSDNIITGNVYYGIRISGRKTERQDLRSLENNIYDNNLSKLSIKKPDEYSDNHADANMFFKDIDGSKTAHIWLGKNTKSNSVKVLKNETLIDEGEENKVTVS